MLRVARQLITFKSKSIYDKKMWNGEVMKDVFIARYGLACKIHVSLRKKIK